MATSIFASIQSSIEVVKAPEKYRPTVAIIGQTTENIEKRIYDGIENYTSKQVDKLFGAKSYISMQLKDAITCCSASGVYKPKIIAIPVQDHSADTSNKKQVTQLTVEILSAANTTLNIRVGKLNPSRLEVQYAVGHAIKYTENSNCSSFTVNGISVGNPSNASKGSTVPSLPFIYDNDVVISVDVKKTDTAGAIAAKIKKAFDLNSNFPFVVVQADEVLTLTSVHVGYCGSLISIELENSSIRLLKEEITAGIGTMDISDILEVKDTNDGKFGDYQVHFTPISDGIVSKAQRLALVEDRYAKYKDVQQYSNLSLQGMITTVLPFDLTKSIDVPAEADETIEQFHIDNPLYEEGVCQQYIVINKGVDVASFKPVNTYEKMKLIQDLQMSCICLDNDKVTIRVSPAYNRSDIAEIKFVDFFFQIYFVKEKLIEHITNTTLGYGENNYTTGKSSSTTILTKKAIMDSIMLAYDHFNGSKTTDTTFAPFSGLIVEDADNRETARLTLESQFSYTKPTKSIVIAFVQDLVQPILLANLKQIIK